MSIINMTSCQSPSQTSYRQHELSSSCNETHSHTHTHNIVTLLKFSLNLSSFPLTISWIKSRKITQCIWKLLIIYLRYSLALFSVLVFHFYQENKSFNEKRLKAEHQAVEWNDDDDDEKLLINSKSETLFSHIHLCIRSRKRKIRWGLACQTGVDEQLCDRTLPIIVIIRPHRSHIQQKSNRVFSLIFQATPSHPSFPHPPQ